MLAKIKGVLSKWFTQKQETVEELFDRLDVYLPRERAIYSYFDGQQMRHADPMVIYRKVVSKGVEIENDEMATRVPGSKFALDAHNRLIKNIREIFDVKSMEEGGLGELECKVLLDHFWTYATSVKKNSSSSGTAQEETSPPTVQPTNEAANQGTWNTSGSGSTEKENTTKEQDQSPTPSPSPSGSSS